MATNKVKDYRIQNYRTDIFQTLKKYWPDVGISKSGIEIINSFTIDFFQRIAMEASYLLKKVARITLMPRDIEAAITLCLTGEVSMSHVINIVCWQQQEQLT